MLGVSITRRSVLFNFLRGALRSGGGITTQRTQTEARKAAFYKFF